MEIDGWDHSFSSLPSWRAVFLFTMEKNVMDAHEGHLLGDGTFEHPGQMLCPGHTFTVLTQD